MTRINRAQLCGKPLDDDCRVAYTTTHEYGELDNRVFCYGLIDKMNGEHLSKCKKCKAFVGNAEPLESGTNISTGGEEEK